MKIRTAVPADVEAITAAITTAFFDDPLWGPAFPDETDRAGQASQMWRLFVTSSLRHSWTFVTAEVESAALWVPPGETELTPEEEEGFEQFLTGVAGAGTTAGILEIFGLLAAARPSEPHFYLSLLATHDDHRGKGLGIGLLADGLARIDDLGAAAYLESSNPAANNHRYEKVGFLAREEIVIPSGHRVTTMFRPPRQAGSASQRPGRSNSG